MNFSFVKRINTTKDSIFYSLIKVNEEIIGYGREHYRARTSKKIKLNENFEIIEDNNIIIKAEDPRCFEYRNKIYILDNFQNDIYLIESESLKSTRIDLQGKNFSFINHNDELYFIYYIRPFELYKINIDTGLIKIVDIDCGDNNNYNFEYRGGTPGYKINDEQYYGYGHRTYNLEGVVKHDIFKWIIYFEKDKLPRISVYDLTQPENSKNICDPTSVIEINNKKYLITAESDLTWFCEQDYVTNVYEILE